jgi:hypothetical protein
MPLVTVSDTIINVYVNVNIYPKQLGAFIMTDCGLSVIVLAECYCSVLVVRGILSSFTQLIVDDSRRDKIPVGVFFYHRSAALPPLR